jgi:carbamoyl-phosphate synthase large subunit
MQTRALPARLLLTSAGSGVARCILDALAGRRDHVWLIGADSNRDAPALRECDEALALPSTDDPTFAQVVADVCRDRAVDLVLPGRDPDALLLAQAADDPDSSVRMPAAPAPLVAMTRDKWATYRWCVEHGIEFADSVATDLPDAAELAALLVARHGFPLVSKPRTGSASLGVTVILHEQQLAVALSRPRMLLQPFLSPPPAGALQLDTSAGVPLFWEVPCLDEPGVMGLIGPDGEIGPHLCFTGSHRIGRTENLLRLDDPDLEAFAVRTLERIRDEGWRGPINLQVRRGRDGWRIIEINPRFTGGTSSRLHLGLDEVRWIVGRWLGKDVIPPWPHPPVSRVDKYMREMPMR